MPSVPIVAALHQKLKRAEKKLLALQVKVKEQAVFKFPN